MHPRRTATLSVLTAAKLLPRTSHGPPHAPGSDGKEHAFGDEGVLSTRSGTDRRAQFLFARPFRHSSSLQGRRQRDHDPLRSGQRQVRGWDRDGTTTTAVVAASVEVE